MHILLIEAEIRIPESHSLKEKRSVMKRLLNEIRRDYNVSAAEVAHHDAWQQAGLAFAAVGNMKKSAERIERQLEELLEFHDSVQLTMFHSQWL